MSRVLLILCNFVVSLLLLFYFMGHNPFEYLGVVYAKTTGWLVFSFGVFLILCLIARSYEKIYKKTIPFANGYITLYFFVIDILILGCTLFKNDFVRSYAMAYFIQVLMFIIWKMQVLKNALYALFCLLLFNASLYFLAIFGAYKPLSSLSYGIMKSKPNIYLLVLESYQGNEALKKLYHYDNSRFLNELEEMDFKVYNNIYSNAPYTRASLSSIFAISDLKSIPENLIDNLLARPGEYKVTNTFLSNGYEIAYMFPTTYLTQMDSRCSSELFVSSLFAQNYLNVIHSDCSFRYETFKSYMEALKEFATEKRDNPLLFITKIGGISENVTTYSGGVVHIPNKLKYTNSANLLPKLRKDYIIELEKENALLKDIIQEIIRKDPASLIILIGDHGGDFWEIYNRRHSKNIAPFLNENSISKEDFLLDFYNIVLAIKWPDHMKGNEKIQMAPELFKIVFEKLIPEADIPAPSSQFFDYNAMGLTDVSLERRE